MVLEKKVLTRRCSGILHFVGRAAAHQTVFSVACSSGSDVLAALQAIETVVRTQRHHLDADKFLMFSVG